MASFLYPTQDDFHDDGSTWLDRMRDQFKDSNAPTFTFAFLKFKPTTLPVGDHSPYWLYFFFSQKKSNMKVGAQVPYRVRVIATSPDPLHADISELPPGHRGSNCKMYFRADLIEEIRAEDGSPYSSHGFTHEDGVTQVLQAARTSIPPVHRNLPLIVVQRTFWELVD